MKKVLGLDLGTNSIGWALIEQDFDKKEGQILGMGSWIIPTDPEMMGRFSSGLALSKANAGQAFTPTGKRTDYRGSRHLRERHLLRRERLHRILNVLGFLPEHYASQIDFDKHLGQFLDEKEPKIAWKEVWNEQKGKNDFEFLFQKSFGEMVEDFKVIYGDNFKIPYDWTIYYLRKKALTYKLEKEELAWLILNFNQKRGYYQLRGEEKEENPNKLVEFHSLKVVDVKADIAYKLILDNGMEYRRETSENLFEWKDRELRFAVTTYLESDGTPKKEENGTDKRSIYMLKENETVSKAKKGTKIEERLLKIVDVQEDKDKKKEEVWYALTLENGWVYRRSSKTPLFDWKDKVRDFIVTTDLNDDGTVKTDKDGADKRSFRAPGEDDWTLLKKKTEADIDKSQKTVGQYIYETLLENPSQKIRGKLVRTIERKFYKDELRQILKKQIELQPELFTTDLYNDCVRELYRSNETQQTILSKRDFLHLFLNDIIFYQRPLRSQKSSIGNCSLEYVIHKINKKDEKGKPIKNVFEKDVNGNDIKVKEYLKGIPKSNPYYQEFRIWQWLYNLKIYRKIDDTDVTTDFIKNTDDIVELFEFLMTKKEVNHKDILQYFLAKQGLKGKAILAEIAKYRWNYVFDDSKDKEEDKSKKYPCNTTGYEIIRRLEKIENVPENLLTPETEYQLWHIIYSVTDKIEFEKAIRTFATKRHSELVSESQNKEEITGQARNGGFVDSFVENFKKFPPFKSEYGSFSEKAIKKLLPLMRLGKYWSYEAIDEKTRERISKIITGEYDETIKTRLREKAINLTSENDFQGLQLWLAQYVVYNRHSEADNVGKWHSIADLEKYLKDFKQHSLRNPIVEQVVTETLRVVRDIWKKYGNFDEIHVELGREMKNTAEDRAKITNQVTENENTNLRIKTMLMEFANDDDFKNQKDYTVFKKEGEDNFFYQKGNNPVRPYSQTQHDILKIFEEYVLNDVSKDELEKETGLTETKDGKTKKITYKDISQKSSPSNKEVEKYKLWLEQKYRSPYTGQMIPLSKLFTPEYQIEHIIPKSRYFDDSLNNKVICETAVNQLKDKQLGLEFIKNHKRQKVDCGMGKTVEIFTEEAYTKFINEHYAKNNAKRRNLLLEDIPDKMIARQMNDTRYISKFISNLLSNIVREETNDDGINSKNLIPGNGKITTTLKQDWGLNEVWNSLILPRFERMNELTQTDKFTAKNSEGHTIPAIPLELSKGFQKKRIDHRHHAMDALVIACATRNHVNLLNNQHALAKDDKERKKNGEVSRYDLQNKLRNQEKWIDKDGKKRDKFTSFKMPWDNFTVDAKNELGKIVVSFKQNLRVINKATNKYEKIKNGKKEKETQKGTNWAIRKPLHKEFVYAKVDLPNVKLPKGKIITAIRRNLDATIDINKITDTGIQKILTKYLESHGNDKELAFSPEGIEDMNKNIAKYNNGKPHQPIYKVRTYEVGSGRFTLGDKGNKKTKFVEAAKGTNLFFAIYADKNGNRNFETIPLNIVIERLKQGLTEVPETNEKGHKLLFHLSPNDLVYVPTEDEKENINGIDFGNLSKEQKKRLFNVNDFSSTCYFAPNRIAKAIAAKEVDMSFDEKKNKVTGSFDTKTASFEGVQIKDVCIKLKIDSLGNIKPCQNPH